MIYPIELFNGHAIIRTQTDTLLVDTGAPQSIHPAGSVDFAGSTHLCHKTYHGATVELISRQLGMPITALLGNDVLAKYRVRLDYQDRQAEFCRTPIDFHGDTVRLSNVMGVPVIALTVEDRACRFFLDTGAQYSYLSGQLLAHYPQAGEAQDFHPMLGQFTVRLYEVPMFLGDHSLRVTCGAPVPMVQQMLSAGGCDGIMGFDLFNSFRVVLDLANWEMKYNPRP